jgi:hypothetical protein
MGDINSNIQSRTHIQCHSIIACIPKPCEQEQTFLLKRDSSLTKNKQIDEILLLFSYYHGFGDESEKQMSISATSLTCNSEAIML